MKISQILLEYKRDTTAKNYGAKLLRSGKRDRVSNVDDILIAIEAMDPTSNKQYTQWLAKAYGEEAFRLEDASQVKQTLERFDNIKSRLDQKDINQYTYRSLSNLMDQIFDPELARPTPTASYTVPEDVKVLYNGPLGLLAVPETEKASCELGRGTKWCTAAKENNQWANYVENGPLYIWRDKNGEKYQFHFDLQEFTDSRNHPIENMKEFLNTHPVVKKLFDSQAKKIDFRINQNAAVRWAKFVLQGRWPEAEPYIVKKPSAATIYAADVLKTRWPELEQELLSHPFNPIFLYHYALDVVKGRWPEGEKKLLNSPENAYVYARDIIKGRWPEAEPVIASDPLIAFEYAYAVTDKRWPEDVEKTIIQHNPNIALRYIIRIVKKRVPLAEKLYMSKPKWALVYADEVIQDRWPEAEKFIMQNAESARKYSIKVLGERWPEAEPYILRSPVEAAKYAKFWDMDWGFPDDNDLKEETSIKLKSNDSKVSNKLINHVYNSGVYQRNPLNWKEIILHQEDNGLVLVHLSPSQMGSNWTHVNFLRAVPEKSGLGKIGINKLKALAEKFNTGLEMQVWEEGPVSPEKLKNFYIKAGFKELEDGTFTWEPENPISEKKMRMHLRDLTNEASDDEDISYQEIQFLPVKSSDVKTKNFKRDLKSIDGVISVVKKQPNDQIQISAIIEHSADANTLLDLAKKYGIAVSKNHTVTDAYVAKALGGKLENQDESEYLSPEDIHQLADKKGIPWDNDPAFLELTKRLTGKAHLDSLDSTELEKVKQYLERLPQSNNKFEKAGYQQLTSNLWMKDKGSMAKLLMRDAEDRSESKAIRLFWELTKKYPNLPNLPKFMQDNGEEYTEIKLKNVPYVMFNMEQLNPIAENSAEENLVYELDKAIKEGKAWQTVWEKVKNQSEFANNVNYTAQKFKVLYKTLELLNKVAKINNYTLDTDLDSVMIRPSSGELVFTLPWRLP